MTFREGLAAKVAVACDVAVLSIIEVTPQSFGVEIFRSANISGSYM